MTNCPYCNHKLTQGTAFTPHLACQSCIGKPFFNNWDKLNEFLEENNGFLLENVDFSVQFQINEYFIGYYPATQALEITKIDNIKTTYITIPTLVTPDNINNTLNRVLKLYVFL